MDVREGARCVLYIFYFSVCSVLHVSCGFRYEDSIGVRYVSVESFKKKTANAEKKNKKQTQIKYEQHGQKHCVYIGFGRDLVDATIATD